MVGCIIVDIDSTLSDGMHREHLVPVNREDYDKITPEERNRDWKAYFEACMEDAVHKEVVDLISLYNNAGYMVVILTARRLSNIVMTTEWLTKHNIRYDAMFMKPDDDYQTSADFKLERAKVIEKLYGPIHFALEDQLGIVKLFRENGIVCFHVRNSPVDQPRVEK